MANEVAVFLPAYNEAEHISTTIASINAQQPNGQYHFSVQILPNGCTDNTAQLARDTIAQLEPNPSISFEVVELPEASKTKTLNHALGQCAATLAIYLDADVTVSGRCFEQVAAEFEDVSIQLGGAVPRYKIPSELQKTYLDQIHRARQLYHDAAGPMLRPMGRLMAFRTTAVESFFENTAAEDAWLLATIAKDYGWGAVRVAQDASVYATAQGNWIDFIQQESRFVRGNRHLAEVCPELGAVILEGRRIRREQLRPRAEIETIIRSQMEVEGLPMSLLDDLLVIEKIYFDNSGIMASQLVGASGRWAPVPSTKRPVS